jgi:hypothetical protein
VGQRRALAGSHIGGSVQPRAHAVPLHGAVSGSAPPPISPRVDCLRASAPAALEDHRDEPMDHTMKPASRAPPGADAWPLRSASAALRRSIRTRTKLHIGIFIVLFTAQTLLLTSQVLAVNRASNMPNRSCVQGSLRGSQRR